MKGFLFLSFFALLLLFILSTEGVQRTKFKTCSQRGFCSRSRAKLPSSSLKSSALQKASPSSFRTSFHRQGKAQEEFDLELVSFENSIVRLRITEKNEEAKKKRYFVQDVIEPSLKEVAWKKTQLDSSSARLELSDSKKVVIDYDPLLLTFFVGDKKVVSINARGLLNIEPFGRQKIEDEECDDCWGDGDDSRPNGPTAVTSDITFHESKHVYGIPEHASDLSLKSTRKGSEEKEPYRLYNLDVFEYELDEQMALYGAIPLMISHTPSLSSAIFWNNAAETFIDIEHTDGLIFSKPEIQTQWISESGAIEIFILLGPTIHDVFQQYASLTGTTPLPPMFSLAYHQCRWNYRDEADVKDVDARMDANDLPYDVIWLDIEHTDSKKYFTWDGKHFPSPEVMQANIASKGRKMVVIVDPHIKSDSGYYIHEEASAKDLWVKNQDGNTYNGFCWPGPAKYPDFTNPVVRDWWSEQFAYDKYKTSSNSLYVWNDMNEPSVFDGPEVTMRKDAVHNGGWEHRDVHNQYGFYYHMATWKGLLNRNAGQNVRPFLLTRSFYAGSQKYGAMWTGDNGADWGHLRYAQRMLLSLNVAGYPFSGADVGGFFGNPGQELLSRFYQAGAYFPFFRGHAHIDSKRREPYLSEEPYRSHIRNAIRARYTLLPEYYTLFKESMEHGTPVMRPMWVEFPKDEKTYDLQDQYLVGKSLMIAPVYTEAATDVSVYFPQGTWYDYRTHAVVNGAGQTTQIPVDLSYIPVYQRGGTILTRKDRPRRASSMMIHDPYTLQIALDTQFQALGRVYIDDGNTHDYKNGSFYDVALTFDKQTLRGQSKGYGFGPVLPKPQTEVERVVILGLPRCPESVQTPKGPTTFRCNLISEANEKLYEVIVKKPQIDFSAREFSLSLN